MSPPFQKWLLAGAQGWERKNRWAGKTHLFLRDRYPYLPPDSGPHVQSLVGISLPCTTMIRNWPQPPLYPHLTLPPVCAALSQGSMP